MGIPEAEFLPPPGLLVQGKARPAIHHGLIRSVRARQSKLPLGLKVVLLGQVWAGMCELRESSPGYPKGLLLILTKVEDFFS